MAEGIRVFNADGSLAYDTQYRLFRMIARVNYGVSNGSAGFSRQPEDTSLTAAAISWYPPMFSVDLGNNTISWDFANVPAIYRIAGVVEIWGR